MARPSLARRKQGLFCHFACQLVVFARRGRRRGPPTRCRRGNRLFERTARTLLRTGPRIVVRPSPAETSFVAVVAESQQTLDNLSSYFERVGIASDGARGLPDPSMVPLHATSLVLFPDDFERARVESFILQLRRARPQLLILLVSSAPQHLGAAVAPDGRSVPPLVLPRPAFGWTILDAIRARAADAEADD